MSSFDIYLVDVIRFVTLALLIISLAMCAAVNRLYFRAIRFAGKREGLAPVHVVLVTLGVIIIQAMLAWGVMEGVGPRSVSSIIRFCGYSVGSIIIIVALYIVGTLQRRRVQFSRGTKRTLTVTESTRTDVHDSED